MSDLIEQRRKKLDELRSKGIDPFPAQVHRTHACAQALALPLAAKVTVAGRIRSWRSFGELVFADLEDDTGRIQVLLKKETLKDDAHLLGLLDIGDFIEVQG